MPVSGERTGAIQSTGVPGNCCPSVTQCHKSNSLAVGRLFPWCPLLRIVSAARVFVESKCSKRSPEGLSEDACHLWGVEVIAISARQRDARS